MANVKAKFIWLDGYEDYRSVALPLRPVWSRYEFERDDKLSYRDIYMNLADILNNDAYLPFATVNFNLCRYSDNTFEYKQIV